MLAAAIQMGEVHVVVAVRHDAFEHFSWKKFGEYIHCLRCCAGMEAGGKIKFHVRIGRNVRQRNKLVPLGGVNLHVHSSHIVVLCGVTGADKFERSIHVAAGISAVVAFSRVCVVCSGRPQLRTKIFDST